MTADDMREALREEEARERRRRQRLRRQATPLWIVLFVAAGCMAMGQIIPALILGVIAAVWATRLIRRL